MRRILRYLNPIAHLGEKDYSLDFPAVTVLAAVVVLEFFAYVVFQDSRSVSLAAIFLFFGLVVYFSFREGIRGGMITAALTVTYYLYIIYTRQYAGDQMASGLTTVILLGILYFFIAWIIGWLKQTIDTLIEREANEKIRLRTILQQLPVGVVVADAQGKNVLANSRAKALLGREIREPNRVEETVLKNTYHNNRPVTPSQWPLVRTLASGQAIRGREFVIEHKNGRRKHLQISASVIHNREGDVIAAASILNDITPQKELEERKDDFVNMASHELKTPITSMKLYVDTLASRIKKTGDKEMQRVLKGISDQTEKLHGLVNDLLDVSRLQTGKMTFTYETFRLDELIAETIEGLRRTTRQQNVFYTKKLPVTVTADKFRIYQVVTNLVTNAIKYSPEGTNITVRMKKEKGKAVVSVKDQGIGIPEDQQKRIFGRLYQVHTATESTPTGLGMGLYICKEIIDKHQGEIWVESKEGKGSTFSFSLPLKQKALPASGD